MFKIYFGGISKSMIIILLSKVWSFDFIICIKSLCINVSL